MEHISNLIVSRVKQEVKAVQEALTKQMDDRLEEQEKANKELFKQLDMLQKHEIFYTNKDNPDCIFVTFKHRSSVTRIFDKTRIMRRGSRVKNYIPWQFRERARAIGELEYNLREVEKCKTKLKMGLNDIQLFKKSRSGGSRWEHVPLDEAELPPIDMGMSGSPSRTVTSSPAPGRPCQTRVETRGSETTDSSAGTNLQTEIKESEVSEIDVAENSPVFKKQVASSQ